MREGCLHLDKVSRVLSKAFLGCPEVYIQTTIILFFDLELCFSDFNVSMGLYTKQINKCTPNALWAKSLFKNPLSFVCPLTELF